MDIIDSIILFSVGTAALLGGFVLYQSVYSPINRSLASVSFGVLLWGISMVFYRNAIDPDIVLWWAKLLYVAPLIITSSFLYFTVVFPEPEEGKFTGRRTVWLLVLWTVLVSCIVLFTNLIIKDVVIQDIEENELIFGSLYLMYVLIIIGMFVLAYTNLLYRKHYSRGIVRKQLTIVFWGTFLASIIGVITNLILPTLGIFTLNWVGQVGALIMVVFMAHTILRYNFLNIKVFAAQLFIILLIVVSFADIFTARSTKEYILRFVFFIAILLFGYLTTRSIHKEIERKNELQKMTDKLARANDELRKLDNAKSEFISIASHQLRTPLTAIKGYISLILEGSYGQVEPKLRDALNKVYIANERLIQLVEDLLNISRIESGRLEYKFDFHRMEDLVNELYDTFVLRAREKGLELTIKKPRKPLPAIEMDYSKIREVISNLIDNAVKYTEKGSVTIIIEKHFNTIRVTVADTGIGVPKELVSQLFEKFSRGKDTNRLHVEGTGLGLYVGRNLVDAHHGRMWVESSGSGRGAKFIVDLPLEQPREVPHHGALEGFSIGKNKHQSKKK